MPSSRSTPNGPLVAVVTPVFNGANHLGGCLESVLAQDYTNWRLVVVDNVSSDESLSIAHSFAARDERVEVRAETEFLPLLENWNRALAACPREARYIKHVSADDGLRPACLRLMVEAAEEHPEVGVVTSAWQSGSRIGPPGSPGEFALIPGPEAARHALLGTVNFLAQPSALMLRREAAPDWPGIYPVAPFPPGHPGSPTHSIGDKAGYLPTFERWSMAYLPEVLSDLRSIEDEGTTTSWSEQVGAWQPGRLEFLLDRGATFLDGACMAAAVRRVTLRYARSLLWRGFRSRLQDREFVQFQGLCLDHLLARLRAGGYATEALLLAPFAAIFARADRA